MTEILSDTKFFSELGTLHEFALKRRVIVGRRIHIFGKAIGMLGAQWPNTVDGNTYLLDMPYLKHRDMTPRFGKRYISPELLAELAAWGTPE
jgi:hypothetical protein